MVADAGAIECATHSGHEYSMRLQPRIHVLADGNDKSSVSQHLCNFLNSRRWWPLDLTERGWLLWNKLVLNEGAFA
jgi:hypothetical protein